MTPSIHITDSELFSLLGFTSDGEQALLRTFMAEQGFERGRNLVAWCVRRTHTDLHPIVEPSPYKHIVVKAEPTHLTYE